MVRSGDGGEKRKKSTLPRVFYYCGDKMIAEESWAAVVPQVWGGICA